MQFQTTPLPTGMILPAHQDAQVTVMEEDGVVLITVARAQGLTGEVTVGYRSIPLTARSPENYKVFVKHLWFSWILNEQPFTIIAP